VISDCRFCFLINLTVFYPFKMSDTTSDVIMVEPYEVVCNPHYTSISRSPSPIVEEDRSLAETFKEPIVNSSRGVEITTQTGTVASAPWPALGGSCSLVGQLQEPRYQAKADVATQSSIKHLHTPLTLAKISSRLTVIVRRAGAVQVVDRLVRRGLTEL